MFANAGKDIRIGSVMRYMFMPQILPRLGQLYSTGFSQLAYFIALVYRGVGILPASHPLFRRDVRIHLGLRQVLAAAAAELRFTRAEIDKVIIYFAILLGLIILAVQFVILLSFVMMNPALANNMPTTYAGFFSTAVYMGCGPSLNPQSDVAYKLLYMVFGVPELFNVNCPVRAFHTALYSLFQLYSIGLLVIALIIAGYMVFAILTETAQTGVPFGKRFNHVWAPIRFVFALGLLIPIGYGLNTAQWITLYAAKFGSDFATRGWVIFNNVMTDAYLSNTNERVGRPQAPELTNLAAYMMIVTACEFAYENIYTGPERKNIEPHLVKNTSVSGITPPLLTGTLSYTAAKNFFNKGDILIRFGEYNPTTNSKYLGYVIPYCGDLVIYSGDSTELGAESIQNFYFETVREMWVGRYRLRQFAEDYIRQYSLHQNNAILPPPDFKRQLALELTRDVEDAVTIAVQNQRISPTWNKNAADISTLGWGGAGIWYNKIAQINGSLVTAVNNVPQAKSMPMVMEYIKAEKLQQNTEVKDYSIVLADGRVIQFNSALDPIVGNGLSAIHEYWNREDTRQDEISNQTRYTNNIVIDVINVIFGTRGLFDMCQSAEVHPLAQLSILGKGLVEASIRNLAVAVGVSALSLLPSSFIGIASGAAAKMLLTVASITITIGFILFYVLPFMPFLYFFFAVGGWIKGLFEAMVGVPLWALAHMRIDGEGLPGDAAISGYFLIFEIFLRPILIVFGLLASVVIFAAMVKVLNEIFYLVVVNLAGHDETSGTLCGQMGGTGNTNGTGNNSGPGSSSVGFFRGPIDELFFTVLYAIIVYMIGMSCFKLIDLVPNNLLRYMNVNVATFNDQQGDPAEGLIFRLSAGTRLVSGQVMEIGSNAAGALGNTARAVQQFAGGGSGQNQGG